MFSHIPNAANAQFSILDAHFFRLALTKGAAIISDYGRVAEIGIDTCLAKVGVSSNVRMDIMPKSMKTSGIVPSKPVALATAT